MWISPALRYSSWCQHFRRPRDPTRGSTRGQGIAATPAKAATLISPSPRPWHPVGGGGARDPWWPPRAAGAGPGTPVDTDRGRAGGCGDMRWTIGTKKGPRSIAEERRWEQWHSVGTGAQLGSPCRPAGRRQPPLAPEERCAGRCARTTIGGGRSLPWQSRRQRPPQFSPQLGRHGAAERGRTGRAGVPGARANTQKRDAAGGRGRRDAWLRTRGS